MRLFGVLGVKIGIMEKVALTPKRQAQGKDYLYTSASCFSKLNAVSGIEYVVLVLI